MAFSIEEQLNSDMDLFFPNRGILPIHIASGGGILPERLMEFDEILNFNAEQFKLIEPRFHFEINPNLAEIKQFPSNYHRNLYLEDFVNKAKRGFYSFDKSDLGNPRDSIYHLVAFPKLSSNTQQIMKLRETFCDEIIAQNFLNSDRYVKLNLLSNI